MQVYCVWAKQQQVTWIMSTIYSAHYWKIGGANSRSRIICREIDLYWE